MKRRVTTPRSTRRRTALKDPHGGLTAAGRKFFEEKEGAHLRPGVRKAGPDMTPEDMKRKGSFLRRHYTTPRGPLVNKKGEPTRYALQAQAWGEPAPKSLRDVRQLAAKGKKLLEQSKRVQPRKKSS